jgi:hypothetical protein
MSAKQILEAALARSEGGGQLRLLRPLNDGEIDALEARLSARLPAAARELLAFASGFVWTPFGRVSFVGEDVFEFHDLLPSGIPLAGDGYGNFWALDVRPDNGAWGTVLFVSHDPPVVVVQARDLDGFVSQVLARTSVEGVTVQLPPKMALERIWLDNPYVIEIRGARGSPDPLVRTFAHTLPDLFGVVDLRSANEGIGFAWGRDGRRSKIVRYGSELLFGIESRARRSMWDRLTGRGS